MITIKKYRVIVKKFINKRKERTMYIAKTTIGFIEVPNKVVCNIFAVGCEHNCEGCHVPHLQNRETTPECYYFNDFDFIEKVTECGDLIDGICWLGGDAMFQEERLVELSAIFKKGWPDKFNAIYTGYKFEEIDPHLLKDIDIIIDGKWEGIPVNEEKTNQRIWINDSGEWSLISYQQFKENKFNKRRQL
jgi:hypothetical protein